MLNLATLVISIGSRLWRRRKKTLMLETSPTQLYATFTKELNSMSIPCIVDLADATVDTVVQFNQYFYDSW